MKAILCNEFGDPDQLRFTDCDTPVCGDADALVKVAAAGVNFPDGLLVQGQYQVTPSLPFIPGMEFCGEVTETGAQVSGLQPGDRVIGMSPEYGAYAEYVSRPATTLIKIPSDLPADQGCNLLIAHGTAQHALVQRAGLRPGERLVVLGAAGGTGLAAVQIGKALGATVVAAASSDEKLELARAQGADHLVNYQELNLKDAIRATVGQADVIYDPVGGELFAAGVRAMARNGRYLVVGFASGEIPKLAVNLALVKEFSVVGVFWGTFVQQEPAVFASNMKQLLDWFNQKKVSVVVERTWNLADTAAALTHVMNRRVLGKVAVVTAT